MDTLTHLDDAVTAFIFTFLLRYLNEVEAQSILILSGGTPLHFHAADRILSLSRRRVLDLIANYRDLGLLPALILVSRYIEPFPFRFGSDLNLSGLVSRDSQVIHRHTYGGVSVQFGHNIVEYFLRASQRAKFFLNQFHGLSLSICLCLCLSVSQWSVFL